MREGLKVLDLDEKMLWPSGLDSPGQCLLFGRLHPVLKVASLRLRLGFLYAVRLRGLDVRRLEQAECRGPEQARTLVRPVDRRPGRVP